MSSGVDPARGALRVVRGTVPAAASGGLAVTAHVCAGGQAPHAGSTVIGLAVIALLGTALAGRRRRGWEILATLGVSHLLLHGLMSHSHDMTTTMLGAHLVGVAVTAFILTRAEELTFALAAAWRELLPRIPLTPPRACAPPKYASTPVTCDVRVRVFARGSIRRRGPPLHS